MSLAQHIAAKIQKKLAKDGEITREKGGPKSRARASGVSVLSRAADLLDLIKDPDAAAAVRVLRDGLKAEKTFWDGPTKSWITQPDFKERRESALSILAYKFGKPVERQIVASGTFQELSEILTRINASPEAMREIGHSVPRHEQDSEKP